MRDIFCYNYPLARKSSDGANLFDISDRFVVGRRRNNGSQLIAAGAEGEQSTQAAALAISICRPLGCHNYDTALVASMLFTEIDT